MKVDLTLERVTVDFSQIPIQVALIAAAVTLLGTLISFLSALLGHWYNRIAKVQDWLFAKRVANIEACTAKLDSWLTELSETSSETSSAFIRIDFEVDLQTSYARTDTAFRKALNETSEMASKAANTALERAYDGRIWIGHDLVRLSTWLEEPDKNEKSFRDLYFRYAKVMAGFSRTANDLENWTEECSYDFTGSTEEITQKLRSYERQLDKLFEERGKVEKEAIILQRTMALELANSTSSFWRFLGETLLHNKQNGATLDERQIR